MTWMVYHLADDATPEYDRKFAEESKTVSGDEPTFDDITNK
jgi:hypothetical protein